jgi:hypothetical protein
MPFDPFEIADDTVTVQEEGALPEVEDTSAADQTPTVPVQDET